MVELLRSSVLALMKMPVKISDLLLPGLNPSRLMTGLEFCPEAGGARQYCESLKNKGLLCKETHDHIIRFAPPLIITKDQIDWALEIISSVLKT